MSQLLCSGSDTCPTMVFRHESEQGFSGFKTLSIIPSVFNTDVL
jgi:hypothetical protein